MANYDFSGTVALVTGAAQGIGSEITRRLIKSGAQVHVADINMEGLAYVRDITGIPHHLDISDRDACFRTVQEIVETEGKIDILVNAAGGSLGKGRGPLETLCVADWKDIFDANLNGAFWLCQATTPHLKKSDCGRIVNIASHAGLRPAMSGNMAYTSAKHAFVGLTRQMAVELGPFGVTVNAVAPGLVMSGPWARQLWDNYTSEMKKRTIESIHTRRLGTSEDIANAVLFLAAKESGWITGQILSVDGGRA